MISTFADDASRILLSLFLLQNDQDAKIGKSNFLTYVYTYCGKMFTLPDSFCFPVGSAGTTEHFPSR